MVELLEILWDSTRFHDHGGVSSVDYILAPEHLFEKVKFFNVQPPNEFSDHCPIWTGLNCKINNINATVPISYIDGKFLWSDISKPQFIRVINKDNSTKSFSNYMAALDLHEFENSNEAVQAFNNILLNIAKESIPFKTRKKNSGKRKIKRSWMDQDCFTLRRT